MIEGEIAGWHLLDRLGAGGMGTVYRAKRGDVLAALKVMNPGLAADPTFRRRFRREAVLAQLVVTPRVARVIAFDADAETPWLATELLTGVTLAEHVRAAGPLAEVELEEFALGLADGLSALHAEGIVHRDVKPSNVMLTPRGPVLVDFGIASAVDLASLTTTGAIVGSPGWIAPEQLDGHDATPASDMFGWAATVAYAGTGRHPFGLGPPDAVLYRIKNAQPDLANFERASRMLLQRALDKSPGSRPPAADIPTLWAKVRAADPFATIPIDEVAGTATAETDRTAYSTAQLPAEPPPAVVALSHDDTERISVTRRRPLILLGASAATLATVIALALAYAVFSGGAHHRGPAAAQSTRSTSRASSIAVRTPNPQAVPAFRKSVDPGSTIDVRNMVAWLENHLQSKVLLDVTLTPTTGRDFAPGSTTGSDQFADTFTTMPRCSRTNIRCGPGVTLTIHDLDSEADATLTGVGWTWQLVGTYVVQYAGMQGAQYVADLRAVPGGGSSSAGTDGMSGILPGVSDCGDSPPVPRPAHITLSCADGYSALTKLRWSAWGQDRAEGQGILRANDCKPDCADGTDHTYPVGVELSNLSSSRGSFQFKTAQITFNGPPPEGLPQRWKVPLDLWR